ncbi:hypothetical protein PsYK624_112660 [Phanerochaete sordida]|uniref:Uncharacterized protein n=1 Tax=Phanerochaete sordida TaxID=48140 RepID=A0A9P3GHY1_9APHY|nr:hypothetical protein PsYK624_112660 [Phanerochaete sordida]
MQRFSAESGHMPVEVREGSDGPQAGIEQPSKRHRARRQRDNADSGWEEYLERNTQFDAQYTVILHGSERCKRCVDRDWSCRIKPSPREKGRFVCLACRLGKSKCHLPDHAPLPSRAAIPRRRATRMGNTTSIESKDAGSDSEADEMEVEMELAIVDSASSTSTSSEANTAEEDPVDQPANLQPGCSRTRRTTMSLKLNASAANASTSPVNETADHPHDEHHTAAQISLGAGKSVGHSHAQVPGNSAGPPHPPILSAPISTGRRLDSVRQGNTHNVVTIQVLQQCDQDLRASAQNVTTSIKQFHEVLARSSYALSSIYNTNHA